MDARQTISMWHDRHYHDVREYIRRRVCAADVDDVAQLTWMRAYLALDRGYQVFSLLPWLHTLARHECAHRVSSPLSSLDGLEEVIEDPSPPFEEILMEQEVYAPVSTRLEKLHPAYRDILSLHYLEGLDYAEIEERSDLPRSLAKVRVYRGLKALRKQLGVTSPV